MTTARRTDPLEYNERLRVRTYEVDENGHVNNATYLQWAEDLSASHAESMGFGREWSIARGAAWLVRRHQATYHRPAYRGEEIELTVRVTGLKGVRGWRHTWVRRGADGVLLAEIETEWVWVRLSDGRPTAVPRELLDAFRPRD